MKCMRCGGTIFSEDFCQRCGSLSSSPKASIPGMQVDSTPALAASSKVQDTYEERISRRKSFRKSYRITFLAGVFFMLMDLYQNSAVDADHLVNNPWPFIFQVARSLAVISFIIALIARTRAPMLFFVWSVTTSIAVRFFAVIYQYGVAKVTLTEWVWGVVGLVVVSSFWVLRYGVHNRIKNW